MIIDTHSQLFTEKALETMPKPMLESYKAVFGEEMVVSIRDILEDMDRAGVTMTVIVAVDAETVHGYKVPNDLIAEPVQENPGRFIGFASVDPHKGKLATEEFEWAIRDLGLKGLKILPHLIEINPNDPLMYPIYKKSIELDVPILFHTGTQFHAGTKIKYCQPLFLDDVAIDFPHLKIILAHFGFPWFYEAVAVIQRNANVYFNIAGWAPRHIPEPMVRYIDTILSHKVLFGSDFPLITRKRIVDELKELPLKEKTLDRIFSENAKRLLNIS